MSPVAAIVLVSQADVQAEKKKPGLFDFDVPKLPYQYERDAAKDITGLIASSRAT